MLAGDGADEEQAEACAFDLGEGTAGDAVEALEDAFVLVWREAYARVCDAEGDPGGAVNGKRAADVDPFRGVFDGVVEDVENGGAEIFRKADDVGADIAWFEDDALGREVVAAECDCDAVGYERDEVDGGAVLLAVTLAELAGLEDQLDGGEETVGVGQHDLVEVLPLGLFDGAALEGFEVEADGGDGGLELVGDGVEEGVLTLVAADLADEEDGVEHDAGDESREEDDAKNEKGDGALAADDDPADVERDGETDEENAEGDKEGDGSTASGDVHGVERSIATQKAGAAF
jgi:hypothetical protein